jgi:putative hydrolase of the HAD superfamily
MIDTVFLDAGGVLVSPNWARVSDALKRRGVDVTPDALEAAEPHAKFRLDQAATIAATNDDDRWEIYFHSILELAGVAPTLATRTALSELREYHAGHNLWETVLLNVPARLARLRALGLQLVVVSNANGVLRSTFERIGLANHVDLLVDSHDEGVEKPDPKLFQIALTRAGARADRTLHVGDLYHVDVLGAEAAGLQGILLDVADLYREVSCRRVRTLSEIADLLAKPTWPSTSLRAPRA